MTFTLYCNGESTGKTVELTKDTAWAGAFRNLEKRTGELLNRYTVRETPVEGYTTRIEEVEIPSQQEMGWYVFRAVNTLKNHLITYKMNGGSMDGSSGPVVEEHLHGEEISILRAPVRDGYSFRYWKGSEYQPGDSYKVTADHTFTAQWLRNDPLEYQFTFTKKWVGKAEDSLSWTLYNPEGSIRHK